MIACRFSSALLSTLSTLMKTRYNGNPKNDLIVSKRTLKKDGVTCYQRKGVTMMQLSTNGQLLRHRSKQLEAHQRTSIPQGL